MPSTSARSRVREWITAQRNATILAAIVVAIPTAYAFDTVVGGTSGDFLLLMTLAVGVPQAYEEYWPRYDRTWKAVAWVLAACAVATGEFVGLHLLGVEMLALSPFLAGVGAFLLTYLGNVALLAYRRRG